MRNSNACSACFARRAASTSRTTSFQPSSDGSSADGAAKDRRRRELPGLRSTTTTTSSNLYSDILIHVTRFFRDPESFAALKTTVFPRIVRGARQRSGRSGFGYQAARPARKPTPSQSRCSKHLGRRRAVRRSDFRHRCQRGGDRARARWGISRKHQPPTCRLSAYGVSSSRVDGQYRSARSCATACIFARQDLTRDPPFSKLDLIVAATS